jgi:hypothetical protein
MRGNIFSPIGPEYGIRRDGKPFGMTCLSLKDAEEMANVLSKDGGKVEIFVRATGQTVANETGQAVEAGHLAAKNSTSE